MKPLLTNIRTRRCYSATYSFLLLYTALFLQIWSNEKSDKKTGVYAFHPYTKNSSNKKGGIISTRILQIVDKSKGEDKDETPVKNKTYETDKTNSLTLDNEEKGKKSDPVKAVPEGGKADKVGKVKGKDKDETSVKNKPNDELPLESNTSKAKTDHAKSLVTGDDKEDEKKSDPVKAVPEGGKADKVGKVKGKDKDETPVMNKADDELPLESNTSKAKTDHAKSLVTGDDKEDEKKSDPVKAVTEGGKADKVGKVKGKDKDETPVMNKADDELPLESNTSKAKTDHAKSLVTGDDKEDEKKSDPVKAVPEGGKADKVGKVKGKDKDETSVKNKPNDELPLENNTSKAKTDHAKSLVTGDDKEDEKKSDPVKAVPEGGKADKVGKVKGKDKDETPVMNKADDELPLESNTSKAKTDHTKSLVTGDDEVDKKSDPVKAVTEGGKADKVGDKDETSVMNKADDELPLENNTNKAKTDHAKSLVTGDDEVEKKSDPVKAVTDKADDELPFENNTSKAKTGHAKSLVTGDDEVDKKSDPVKAVPEGGKADKVGKVKGKDKDETPVMNKADDDLPLENNTSKAKTDKSDPVKAVTEGGKADKVGKVKGKDKDETPDKNKPNDELPLDNNTSKAKTVHAKSLVTGDKEDEKKSDPVKAVTQGGKADKVGKVKGKDKDETPVKNNTDDELPLESNTSKAKTDHAKSLVTGDDKEDEKKSDPVKAVPEGGKADKVGKVKGKDKDETPVKNKPNDELPLESNTSKAKTDHAKSLVTGDDKEDGKKSDPVKAVPEGGKADKVGKVKGKDKDETPVKNKPNDELPLENNTSKAKTDHAKSLVTGDDKEDEKKSDPVKAVPEGGKADKVGKVKGKDKDETSVKNKPNDELPLENNTSKAKTDHAKSLVTGDDKEDEKKSDPVKAVPEGGKADKVGKVKGKDKDETPVMNKADDELPLESNTSKAKTDHTKSLVTGDDEVDKKSDPVKAVTEGGKADKVGDKDETSVMNKADDELPLENNTNKAKTDHAKSLVTGDDEVEKKSDPVKAVTDKADDELPFENNTSKAKTDHAKSLVTGDDEVDKKSDPVKAVPEGGKADKVGKVKGKDKDETPVKNKADDDLPLDNNTSKAKTDKSDPVKAVTEGGKADKVGKVKGKDKDETPDKNKPNDELSLDNNTSKAKTVHAKSLVTGDKEDEKKSDPVKAVTQGGKADKVGKVKGKDKDETPVKNNTDDELPLESNTSKAKTDHAKSLVTGDDKVDKKSDPVKAVPEGGKADKVGKVKGKDKDETPVKNKADDDLPLENNTSKAKTDHAKSLVTGDDKEDEKKSGQGYGEEKDELLVMNSTAVGKTDHAKSLAVGNNEEKKKSKSVKAVTEGGSGNEGGNGEGKDEDELPLNNSTDTGKTDNINSLTVGGDKEKPKSDPVKPVMDGDKVKKVGKGEEKDELSLKNSTEKGETNNTKTLAVGDEEDNVKSDVRKPVTDGIKTDNEGNNESPIKSSTDTGKAMDESSVKSNPNKEPSHIVNADNDNDIDHDTKQTRRQDDDEFIDQTRGSDDHQDAMDKNSGDRTKVFSSGNVFGDESDSTTLKYSEKSSTLQHPHTANGGSKESDSSANKENIALHEQEVNKTLQEKTDSLINERDKLKSDGKISKVDEKDKLKPSVNEIGLGYDHDIDEVEGLSSVTIFTSLLLFAVVFIIRKKFCNQRRAHIDPGSASSYDDNWDWNDAGDIEASNRKTNGNDSDDEDLRRAISLSLQSKKATPPSSIHGPSVKHTKRPPSRDRGSQSQSGINHRSNSLGSRKDESSNKGLSSWEYEAGWESDTGLVAGSNVSLSQSDSDSNLSWSSSSPVQQAKRSTQNITHVAPSIQKAPAGTTVTASTVIKPNILSATPPSERKPSPQVSTKYNSDNDDIFAALGFSADNGTNAAFESTSKNAQSVKTSLRWSTALLEANGSHSVASTSITDNLPAETEIKSNWDDADDELAALLDEE